MVFTTQGSDPTGKEYDIDDDDSDEPKSGICCLGGFLTGCSICVMFMVIFPAGILLTIYATNHKEYDVLSAGVILIAAPAIAVPIVIGIYLYRRQIMRYRKRKVSDQVHDGKEQSERY